jgi:hypothetical protein
VAFHYLARKELQTISRLHKYPIFHLLNFLLIVCPVKHVSDFLQIKSEFFGICKSLPEILAAVSPGEMQLMRTLLSLISGYLNLV